jgi:glutathione S-transferase
MDAELQPLFHLALADEWLEAVERGGPYERSTLGAGLDEVGFIHCSFADQVAPTRERFYGGRHDVVLLRIDPDRLDVEVKVEDLHDSGEAFPHLYGPLSLDAVVEVEPLPQRAT